MTCPICGPIVRCSCSDDWMPKDEQAAYDEEIARHERQARPHCAVCGCDLHDDNTCPEGCCRCGEGNMDITRRTH